MYRSIGIDERGRLRFSNQYLRLTELSDESMRLAQHRWQAANYGVQLPPEVGSLGGSSWVAWLALPPFFFLAPDLLGA